MFTTMAENKYHRDLCDIQNRRNNLTITTMTATILSAQCHLELGNLLIDLRAIHGHLQEVMDSQRRTASIELFLQGFADSVAQERGSVTARTHFVYIPQPHQDVHLLIPFILSLDSRDEAIWRFVY
eukprot:scpid86639/ scgid28226/ 